MADFLLSFSTLRWQDVIDIALNSYILFRLYALFRGTPVFRVLLAIAFLWFLQRVAVSLGLVVTSWAVQGIIAAAALIIIVVFRNEIRSVLQAKNLKAILWGLPFKAPDTPVQIIVESVQELARKRIGALIVLPGKEDLGEVAGNGIPWHGRISREMILSIFWPDNPVHDGAAIIQGDRVTEVGVILPLSHRTDLPSHYGTRHRAAAGLSEMSDALVIAVSEERGTVTMTKASGISEIRRKEEMENRIRTHLGAPEGGSRARRRRKLEFTVAALVSILFVSGVWVGFTTGRDTLATFEIPVDYRNRDPAMEIVKTSANAVQLHLSGSGTLMKSLRPEHIGVIIDLAKAVVGRNTFTITTENVTLPPGIFLKEVDPGLVYVTIDVVIEKALPVQVDWIGRLAEHLILVKATLDPHTVVVKGPKQALENISTLYTEKTPLDPIVKSDSLSVGLALEPASLRVAPGSKEKILVTYVVKERPK